MVHNAYGAAAVKSANTLDEEVNSIIGNSSKLRGNRVLLALLFGVVGPHPHVARMMMGMLRRTLLYTGRR